MIRSSSQSNTDVKISGVSNAGIETNITRRGAEGRKELPKATEEINSSTDGRNSQNVPGPGANDLLADGRHGLELGTMGLLANNLIGIFNLVSHKNLPHGDEVVRGVLGLPSVDQLMFLGRGSSLVTMGADESLAGQANGTGRVLVVVINGADRTRSHLLRASFLRNGPKSSKILVQGEINNAAVADEISLANGVHDIAVEAEISKDDCSRHDD